jgi:hypothetical protein
MTELTIAPRSGGPLGASRFIPPLPAEITILPGPKKPRRVGRKLVLVVIGVIGFVRLFNWYSGYDGRQIEAVVTPAMFAHAKFGTSLPVMLRDGPRIIKIGPAFVRSGNPPSTCVMVYVYGPIPGVLDPRFHGIYDYCIGGLAYEIRYPITR